MTSLKFSLLIGSVNLQFQTDAPFDVEEHLFGFQSRSQTTDVTLNILETDAMPDLPAHLLGDDLLINYYEDHNFRYAAAKPGTAGLIVVTVYRPDFSDVTMYVRKSRLPGMIHSLGKALQLFPIRALLAQHSAMILHASQVVVGGRGILFTAPSGTGKSTQARLWNRWTNAPVICNDRTLLFKDDGRFSTSGFPVDGSDPVYSPLRHDLGAIVVLTQAPENTIQRLSPFRALKPLMEQTVCDIWDVPQREALLALWCSLLEHVPVYLLACTPDQYAVDCLRRQLMEDKVIT